MSKFHVIIQSELQIKLFRTLWTLERLMIKMHYSDMAKQRFNSCCEYFSTASISTDQLTLLVFHWMLVMLM